jgi:hypothetical protein
LRRFRESVLITAFFPFPEKFLKALAEEIQAVPLRISFIILNPPQAVETYEIKFDGNKQPCVSGHYGVALTYS